MDSNKFILWTCVAVFGGIGTYIPVLLFGADPFGLWSIIGSTVGGIFGVWLWYKFFRS